MSKFEIKIKDKEAETVTEVFGISDEKLEVFLTFFKEDMPDRGHLGAPLVELSKKAESLEELAIFFLLLGRGLN